MVRIAWIVGIVAIAAGGCEKAGKEKVERKRVPADAAPPPADAAPAPTDAAPVPGACTGERLELSLAFASSACAVEDVPKAYRLPEAIRVTTRGAKTVRAGRSADVQILVRNSGARAAELYFLHERGIGPGRIARRGAYTSGFEYEIYDSKGNHMIVLASLSSSTAFVFDGRTSRVVLPPGAVAIARARWTARYQSTSIRSAPRNLEPGPYRVKFQIPWVGGHIPKDHPKRFATHEAEVTK